MKYRYFVIMKRNMSASMDKPPSPLSLNTLKSSLPEVDGSKDTEPNSSIKGATSAARTYLPNVVQREMSKMYAARCDISKEEVVPFKIVMDVIKEHYKITNKPEIPRILIRLLYQYQPVNGEAEYRKLVELIEDLLSAIDHEVRDALISMIPAPVPRMRSFYQPMPNVYNPLPRDLLGREERVNPFAQTIKRPLLAQKILSSSASQGMFPPSLSGGITNPNGDPKHSKFINSSLAGQNLISKLTGLSSGHNASQICLEALKRKSVPQHPPEWSHLNQIETGQNSSNFSTFGCNPFPPPLDQSKINYQGSQLASQKNIGQSSWNSSSPLTAPVPLSLPNNLMWFSRPNLSTLATTSSRQPGQQIGTPFSQAFLQSNINPLLTSVGNSSSTITKNEFKKQQLMQRKQELKKCIDSLPKLKNPDGHNPNSSASSDNPVPAAAFPLAWLAMSNYGNGIRAPTPQQLTEFLKQHAHQLMNKEQKSGQQQDQGQNSQSLDSTSKADDIDQPIFAFNDQTHFLKDLLKRPESPDFSDPWESKKTKKMKVMAAGNNGANTNKKKTKRSKK